MKGKYVFVGLTIILFLLLAGCSAGSPPTPTATPEPTPHPGEAVAKSRCIQCHDLGRVNEFASDKEGWTYLVDRMVLLGATLSDDQRDQVIDYLAITYPSE